MTCSRIFGIIGPSQRQRQRSIQSLKGISTTNDVRKRGVGSRYLSSSASSLTSSPTRIFMSLFAANQNQRNHLDALSLYQPHHKEHGRKRNAASFFSGNVENSIQSDLMSSYLTSSCRVSGIGGTDSANGTKWKREIPSRKIALRYTHTHATANPIVSRNKKSTASGWTKPVVSSSFSDLSSTSSDETMSISLSSPLETISENTVGVDMEELLKLASKKTTPLSLKDMYKYAIVDSDNREQRIRNAQFLHSE